MHTALLNRTPVDTVPLHDLERAYGVRVNELSVEQLLALYARAGFLYPAKAARLTPHLDIVRDNWTRLLRAGDSLLYVLTAGDARQGLASVAVWRTTSDSWVWQHLVSEGDPLRSRAVMLGGLLRCIRLGIGESQQNWFRPENRFPARVFGTMESSLGEAHASVRQHAYFALPRAARLDPGGVPVVAYDASRHADLCAVATAARGRLYVQAERLDADVTLESVDRLYRCVGLRRTRHVWLAYAADGTRAIGAAVAHRGPLGLNFSYLENRCDLLLDPALTDGEAQAAARALLAAATAAYDSFELHEIPIATDKRITAVIDAAGGQFLRHYCQGIWLKDGQPSLYRHVDRFYARLVGRADRRGVPSAATA